MAGERANRLLLGGSVSLEPPTSSSGGADVALGSDLAARIRLRSWSAAGKLAVAARDPPGLENGAAAADDDDT